jgi:hypothetical protein
MKIHSSTSKLKNNQATALMLFLLIQFFQYGSFKSAPQSRNLNQSMNHLGFVILLKSPTTLGQDYLEPDEEMK